MEIKIGTKLKIINMYEEPSYTNKIGIVTFVDDIGQLFGTWGSLAIIPEIDKFEILNEDSN